MPKPICTCAVSCIERYPKTYWKIRMKRASERPEMISPTIGDKPPSTSELVEKHNKKVKEKNFLHCGPL